MAVLIGVGQTSWIAYKAYTHGVFAWGEAAGGGDVEAQVVDEFAKVVGGLSYSIRISLLSKGELEDELQLYSVFAGRGRRGQQDPSKSPFSCQIPSSFHRGGRDGCHGERR